MFGRCSEHIEGSSSWASSCHCWPALLAGVRASLVWDGAPTMQPRSPEVWRASSVLFLTQEGFPAGRAVGNTALATADQGRFQSLAVLYAELATSDRVRALAERSGKIDGDIVAEPVIYDIGQYATPVVLPMVRVSVTAPTAPRALGGVRQVSDALQRYVKSGQLNAKIRPRERVLIDKRRVRARSPEASPSWFRGPPRPFRSWSSRSSSVFCSLRLRVPQLPIQLGGRISWKARKRTTSPRAQRHARVLSR